MSQALMTLEQLKGALPEHLKSSASQELCDTVNTLVTDPEAAEAIRDNFVTYTTVLREGKFKITDYMSAVTYVTYKLSGLTNRDAWAKTFPDRYQRLIMNGVTEKEMSSYIASYHRNKLVTLILEQAQIPGHILYQDYFYKALLTQATLMTTAKSEMVRMQAANSVLQHLKAPEKKQISLSVEMSDRTSGVQSLKDMIADLAARQQELIESGTSTREIAHQKMSFGQDISDMIDVTPEDSGSDQD